MPGDHTGDTCSGLSAQRQESMFATASAVRGWLMIEVRGAWGEDAIHTGALDVHVPRHWKDDLKRRGIRAVCVRSPARRDGGEVRMFACAAVRPGGDPAVLWSGDVASLADVVGATADLSADRLATASPPGAPWARVDSRRFFVCTNGRHDQCCANQGRPVVRALRQSPWADRVWECSHIGGDRFAANLVVLPDSLYFGRVLADAAPRLLEALDAGSIDVASFRGRTAYSLAEQAVEHFVRLELGIDGVDAVVVGERADDGTYPTRAGERAVRVRIRRRMVSVPDRLTCRGPGDQLVPEFTLVSIE